MKMVDRAKDHWSFLEEIEAPMWADISLEATSNYRDIDNDWFNISHPIHQCSSKQLRLASCCGGGSTTLDCDIQGPPSPKLPPSVSRSRGKDYVSKKWEGDGRVSFNKQFPTKVLSTKFSSGKSSSLVETKPKLKSSKGTSETTVVCQNAKETCLTRRNFGSTSSSLKIQASESNNSSITYQSSQKQESKFLQESNRACGQTSELLSVIRNSLRKSCVMRQASRVEIRGDKRQSSGCKSSSGKSSVGSSSNPGYDVNGSKYSLRQNNARSMGSNVGRLTQAAKNKINISDVSKASKIQAIKGPGNSRNGYKMKLVHQDAVNSKVQTSAKPLLPQSVNRIDSSSDVTKNKAKERMPVSRLNKMAAGGKENLRGRRYQNHSNQVITTGSLIRDQKGTMKHAQQNKGDGICLVGLKAKSNDPSEGKKKINMIHSVHFR